MEEVAASYDVAVLIHMGTLEHVAWQSDQLTTTCHNIECYDAASPF